MKAALALAALLLVAAQEEDIPLKGDADPELVDLAGKAGREVKWRKANDLDAALEESVSSGNLVFAYVYDRSRSSMFGNAFKDQFMMAGPFVDTELVAFINRKFVPVRLFMSTTLADDLGTRLNDVIVPAVLFINPEKKIVHQYDRITSASTELLYRACRTVLQKNPAFDKPGAEVQRREKAAAEKPDDVRARYLWGLELVWEGRWEKALEVFGEVVKGAPASREAVEGRYRTAWIRRLSRKADEALAAVDEALKANAGVGVKIEGNLLLERALVQLGRGRQDEARRTLEEIVAKHPKDSRTPEARYYLGALDWLTDREDQAKKAWTELAKSEPKTPWNRKAAAEALELGPLTNGWESYDWMAPDVLAGDPKGTERPRKPEEFDQVVREAVNYIVREQRTDGTWRNPKGNGQFEFRNSVTIIARMALEDWKDVRDDRAPAALDRARAAVDAWSDRKTEAKGMAAWDHIFALFHYARLATALPAGPDKDGALKRAKRAMKALAAVQRPKGTWSYTDHGPSSFMTGGALVALWEARKAGLEVDQEMVDHGLEGMLAMKSPAEEKDDPDHFGTYFYSDQSSDEFDDGHLKGSVGRMAICYQAEYLWGKCDLARLTWALDKFLEHRGHLMRVKKSTDWHAGSTPTPATSSSTTTGSRRGR